VLAADRGIGHAPRQRGGPRLQSIAWYSFLAFCALAACTRWSTSGIFQALGYPLNVRMFSLADASRICDRRSSPTCDIGLLDRHDPWRWRSSSSPRTGGCTIRPAAKRDGVVLGLATLWIFGQRNAARRSGEPDVVESGRAGKARTARCWCRSPKAPGLDRRADLVTPFRPSISTTSARRLLTPIRAAGSSAIRRAMC